MPEGDYFGEIGPGRRSVVGVGRPGMSGGGAIIGGSGNDGGVGPAIDGSGGAFVVGVEATDGVVADVGYAGGSFGPQAEPNRHVSPTATMRPFMRKTPFGKPPIDSATGGN